MLEIRVRNGAFGVAAFPVLLFDVLIISLNHFVPGEIREELEGVAVGAPENTFNSSETIGGGDDFAVDAAWLVF